MLLILLLASLWPCLNCQNLTTILSTPLTTQATTTLLPTTLTSILTTSASIVSNTATQSTQSTTKITNPPTIIPSNLPTIPALPTLAPLPSQTTRQPGIYPSQQTITANQVPGATASQLRILIGLMIPSNSSESAGYDNTASAMTIAMDRVRRERMLPLDTNFTQVELIVWKYEECVKATSIGYAFDLIVNSKVDVLFAPPCIDDNAVLASHVGSYFNTPVMLWGSAFDSEFTEKSLYPTVLSALPNYADLANVICSAMNFLDWTLYALIYQASEDGGCFAFSEDMEAASNVRKDCTIGYKEVVDSWAQVDIDYTMQQLQQKARIIVLCFDDIAQQREFAIQLQKAKMDTKDYVYLIADVDMQNGNGLNDGLFDEPFWADTNQTKDGQDELAWKIAQQSFFVHVDKTSDEADAFTNFSDEVVQRMSDWPFYCQHCANPGDKASIYANTLYDSFYLYSTALSRLVNSSTSNIQNKVYRDGDLFTRNATGIQFEGLSGTVNLGADGVRNSIYMLSKYADKLGNLKPFVAFVVADGGITPQNASSVFANDSTGIWFSRDGFHPPSVPKCGFDGKGCPIDVFEEYKGYMIAAIVIGIGLFIAILSGLFYILRLKIREQEAQRRLWQLSISQLIKPAKKNPALESARSLQSGPSSTSTKLTLDSVKSNSHYMVYVFNGERVIGQQHQISGIRIDNRDMAEMQTMRNFDHDNLNRFIGLAIEATQSISVWRFCSRGPLCDVLVGANMLTMDAFFIYSLVKDICEGLKFLHSSSITYHGNLKSTNCLLDERWQIKLSDFGLKFLRNHSNQPEEMLWTSPEILRDPLINGTKPGDVYSFGIVCVEILNMKPPWESLETKQPPEDIVYMLRKGGKNPPRPKLDPVASDLSPAFQHLVRDCFAETPSERPKIETIFTLLHSMNTSRSTNLMDHVFQMLESYAGSLESEVEERTKELIEEKKKSDILLYRMLPKQIAEKLKVGQGVEPESYESVTIFFSDIVSFTTLSSRCTPLQVVNLLNDLYTLLDSIIAEFDVYKVETIGDGYLCVSGLPHKNGNEHARHIANMSLSFIRNIKHFTIPHLPGEQIKLRIGLHSGSCVSGVVGLTMPRYCLFGDAINMASRMESNGKANRIHISSETNHLLTRVIGGYLTTSRGEIIVKGKGTVTTYWLLGMEGDPIAEQQMYTEDIQHKPSIIPESEDV